MKMNYVYALAILSFSGLASAAPKFIIDTTAISPTSSSIALDFDSDVDVTMNEITVKFSDLPTGITHTLSSPAGGFFTCSEISSTSTELEIKGVGADTSGNPLPVPTDEVCKVDFDFASVTGPSGNITVTKGIEEHLDDTFLVIPAVDTALPATIAWTNSAAATTFPVTITAPAAGTVACTVDGTAIADGDQVEDGKDVVCTMTVSDPATKELDAATCVAPGVPAGDVCTTKVSGGPLTVALTEKDKTTAGGTTFPVTITAPAVGSVECKVDGTVIADGDQVEDGKEVACTLTVSDDTTKELDPATCGLPAVAVGNVCTNKVDGGALTFALTETDKLAAGTTFAVNIVDPTPATVECKVDGAVIATGDLVENGKDVVCTLTVSDSATKEFDTASCATPVPAGSNVCTTTVSRGILTITLKEKAKGPAPVTGPAKSVPSTSFWSLVLMLTSMFGIAFMVSKEK